MQGRQGRGRRERTFVAASQRKQAAPRHSSNCVWLSPKPLRLSKSEQARFAFGSIGVLALRSACTAFRDRGRDPQATPQMPVWMRLV